MIRSLGERYAVERVESARLQLARSLEREAALARKLAHSPVVITDLIRAADDALYSPFVSGRIFVKPCGII